MFFLAFGVAFVIMGLFSILIGEGGGVPMVVLGVIMFIHGRNKRKQRNAPAPEPVPEPIQPKPQAAPVIRPRLTVEPAETPKPKLEGVKTITLKAKGISRYQDAVKELGIENEEYRYTKKQIIEEGLEDEEISDYSFYPMDAYLIEEPENPYDSNAIAIYVHDSKIGYVDSGLTSIVKKILRSGNLISSTCEIVGGNYRVYDSEDEEFFVKELSLGARITLEYKAED